MNKMLHNLTLHTLGACALMIAGLGLVAVLAACGSSVKLDDVPVEDRTGTAAGAGAGVWIS